ncbi:MAG: VOC family protein [Candidatus Limnocylindria bacterium]
MSERDGFQPGVPSWVDVTGPDPAQLTDFYGAVFDWDFIGPGQMPGDPPGEYFVAQVRGRDVAGVASLPPRAEAPGWTTYIEVASVDRAAEDVKQAGGAVVVEPFDALPAGRIAVVADPTGAAFCIWEPRERRGAQLVNEPSAWSMSALNTGDRDGAAEFYGAVFGWTLDSFQLGDIDVGLFRLPGYVGGEPEQPVPRDLVATMLPQQNGGARWSVDFWVDDIDRVVTTVAERGGSIVAEPYDVPPLRQAVVADPNGVPFSVSRVTVGG